MKEIRSLLQRVLILEGLTFLFPLPALAREEGWLWDELIGILGRVIALLLRYGALAALGFLVYGGILYITSSGDEKALTTAKSTITYAVVGFILILGAQLAIRTFCGVLGVEDKCFP